MTRQRLARTTTTLANGTKVTKTKVVQAPVLEWRLQAAAVRALRNHPSFGQTFTLAGDMNSARRGPQAQMQAKATGLAPGEPDLRLYIAGGRLCSIEYKAARGRLSPEQVARHALLARLGFTVAVVKAATEAEATEKTLALLAGWLPANDNKPWRAVN